MQLKKYTNFHMDFANKYTHAFGALTGLSFFLRVVYYFGLTSFRDVNILELLTVGMAGIVLCGVIVVLYKKARNAPGLYAIFGAVQCLLMIILALTGGSALRIVFAIIWYIPAALILLATAGGYLPGKLLAALMFFVPIAVRILFFGLGKLGMIGWVQELSMLSALAAFGCFAMSLKSVRMR